MNHETIQLVCIAVIAAAVVIQTVVLLGVLAGVGKALKAIKEEVDDLKSSVIPYVCDQLAMARLPRASFALLLSLLPATAAVVGLVVLRQIPSPAEIVGIALVVAGVALHRPVD